MKPQITQKNLLPRMTRINRIPRMFELVFIRVISRIRAIRGNLSLNQSNPSNPWLKIRLLNCNILNEL